MQCYFTSHKPGSPEKAADGTVSFVIPELNITFHARTHGTKAACEYASLLALLEFVEINPRMFEEKVLEIFGDSFTVINQVNDKMLCRKELQPQRNTALILKQRIPYTLGWIAATENPASAPPAAI